MSYRDILVHVDARSAASDRARLAARLAARQGAHLTGVFLASDFFRQYGAFDGVAGLSPSAIDDLLKEQHKAVEEAGETARTVFGSAAAEAGVQSEWLSVSGDDAQPLVGLARRADLTVFPLDVGELRADPNLGRAAWIVLRRPGAGCPARSSEHRHRQADADRLERWPRSGR